MPTAINAIVKARFGREAALETQVDDKGRTLRRWISLNTTNDPAVKEAVDWLRDALRFEEIEAFTYDQEAVTRVNSGYWIPRGSDTFSTGDIAIPRGTFVSNPEYPNNDGAGLCFQELAFMKALSIGQDTKLKAIDSPQERLEPIVENSAAITVLTSAQAQELAREWHKSTYQTDWENLLSPKRRQKNPHHPNARDFATAFKAEHSGVVINVTTLEEIHRECRPEDWGIKNRPKK